MFEVMSSKWRDGKNFRMFFLQNSLDFQFFLSPTKEIFQLENDSVYQWKKQFFFEKNKKPFFFENCRKILIKKEEKKTP